MFNLEFQTKSNAELLRKYKIKVENAKTMKKSKGSISMQEQEKVSTLNLAKNQQPITNTTGTIGGGILKQDQRKQYSLTTGSAIQGVGHTQILPPN